jgi:hypothetical protein
MKYLLSPLYFYSILLFSFTPKKEISWSSVLASPLSDYSSAWNNVKYLSCNTAANVGYMNAEEKEVVYILNMALMSPALFANTVVKQYPGKSGEGYLVNSDYYKSLMPVLLKLIPPRLLIPDSLCYESAKCHAIATGKKGIVSHNRTEECQTKQYYQGECCDYGHNKPLDIVMAFLIDDRVPSLGHRKICLDSYNKLGVSIQPHLNYGYTSVLDFIY